MPGPRIPRSANVRSPQPAPATRHSTAVQAGILAYEQGEVSGWRRGWRWGALFGVALGSLTVALAVNAGCWFGGGC